MINGFVDSLFGGNFLFINRKTKTRCFVDLIESQFHEQICCGDLNFAASDDNSTHKQSKQIVSRVSTCFLLLLLSCRANRVDSKQEMLN